MHYVRWFIYLLVSILFGCAAPASSGDGPTPIAPKLVTYDASSCGTFAGYKALMAVHCRGVDTIAAAGCQFDGGPAETSRQVDPQTWECATTWDDSTRGGSICVQLECETVADGGLAR